MSNENSNLDLQKQITEKLAETAKGYYNAGETEMSDYRFDVLTDQLAELEEETGMVLPDSPTHSVGAEVGGETVTLTPEQYAMRENIGVSVAHEFPALSLGKVKYKVKEKLSEWLPNGEEATVSWKMDGLTLVLTYDNGKLTSAVTRGNGYVGKNVTPNAKYFKGIPQKISYMDHLVLRGEAIMTYEEFNRINEETGMGFENPRNLAAATVQAVDESIVASREISFYAFELAYPVPKTMTVQISPDMFDRRLMYSRIRFLAGLSFNTVEICDGVTAFNIQDIVDRWAKKLENGLPYPTDGLVFSFNNLERGMKLGMNSHHPLWAVALKWTDETVSTVIRDVEWGVGKTGVITPVAIFDPVRLGAGSTVTRASLCNLSVMDNLPVTGDFLKTEPVMIGSKAEVYLANMIIPKIASVQNSVAGETSCFTSPVNIPAACPACGGPTRIKTSAKSGVRTLVCDNPACSARRVAGLMNTFSREGLYAKGLGESQIEDLLEVGLVDGSPLSFYVMADEDRAHGINPREDEFSEKVSKLWKKDGWGKKKWDNLISAIDASRNTTLQKFLYSLNIPLLGNDLSKKFSKFCKGSINRFKALVDNCLINPGAWYSIYKKDLLAISGIGEEKLAGLENWLRALLEEKSRYDEFANLLSELKFAGSISIDDVTYNLDDFEPTDSEGKEMEGPVTYKGKQYNISISWYVGVSWETSILYGLEVALEREAEKDPSQAKAENNSLAGLTFVITGDVHTYKNRDEFKASVEARGGKVSGSVSSKTTCLVCNDKEGSSSSKMVKARSLGLEIITEDEFIERYGK